MQSSDMLCNDTIESKLLEARVGDDVSERALSNANEKNPKQLEHCRDIETPAKQIQGFQLISTNERKK